MPKSQAGIFRLRIANPCKTQPSAPLSRDEGETVFETGIPGEAAALIKSWLTVNAAGKTRRIQAILRCVPIGGTRRNAFGKAGTSGRSHETGNGADFEFHGV